MKSNARHAARINWITERSGSILSSLVNSLSGISRWETFKIQDILHGNVWQGPKFTLKRECDIIRSALLLLIFQDFQNHAKKYDKKLQIEDVTNKINMQ